jgi:DNA-binding NtrC family response regulator
MDEQPDLNKCVVLIVEDSATQAQQLSQQLTNGFECVLVKSLAEARLHDSACDAVILDLILPDSPAGEEAVAYAKAVNAEMPVIVMTAHANAEVCESLGQARIPVVEKGASLENLSYWCRGAMRYRSVASDLYDTLIRVL